MPFDLRSEKILTPVPNSAHGEASMLWGLLCQLHGIGIR